MSYIGKNPKVKGVVLDDIGVSTPTNPAAGSHKLVNRAGAVKLLDSAGNESSLGGGATAIKVTLASHGFSLGAVLYLNGGTYTLAKADAANTSELVGLVSKVIDANTFEITTAGAVSGLSGLTAGQVYFLSAATAGAITATEPTTIGYISKPIGVAYDATTLILEPSRGVVIGGANARTSLSLVNNSTNNIQSVSAYEAGELTGWVAVAASTPLKFYVSAPFSRNGAGTDYLISPSYMGDTPPVGFSMTVTSAGVIQLTLPSIAGFASASINYALNAPAVGATFPLSVDAATITTGTVAAARLPQVSGSAQGAFPASNASLDDATATRLGLKQYLHGTTYNGGNAPTVGGGSTSVQRATFIPYQTQDGAWRLRSNIVFSCTAATSKTITINGIVFKTGFNQGGSGMTDLSPPNISAPFYVDGGNSSLNIYAVSGSPTGYRVCFDFELDSKPTWAY